MAQPTFDQAYPALYQGWNKSAAQADFNTTGGANKAGYSDLVSSLGGSSSSGSSGTPGPSSSGMPSANPNDYYSQALGLLQPIINSQVSPLKTELGMLPSIYSGKETALQHEATNSQNIFDTQKTSNLTEEGATRDQLNRQEKAAAGAQRANSGAMGIASGSGVEQSQEANIRQNLADKLVNLDNITISKNNTLTAEETQQVQSINDQIAQLPNQQALDALNIGSKISEIEGSGASQAMNYAAEIAKMNTEMYFKQADLALREQNNEVALQKLQQAISYDNASLALSTSRNALEQNQFLANEGGGMGIDPNTGKPTKINASTSYLNAIKPRQTQTTENPWYGFPVLGSILGPLTGPKSTSTTSLQLDDPLGVLPSGKLNNSAVNASRNDPLGLNL